jgi:hypothetical protein
MSLVNEVKRTLANWPLFASGSQWLEAADTGQQLRCELVALDTLACSFGSLRLASATLAGAAIGKLTAVANLLSRRLTYLLEPISPVEIDALGCLVQLRSNPPTKDSDGTSYYELLVGRDGNLSLCRFTRLPGTSRLIVPANVTREVLLRLTNDFATVAAT